MLICLLSISESPCKDMLRSLTVEEQDMPLLMHGYKFMIWKEVYNGLWLGFADEKNEEQKLQNS